MRVTATTVWLLTHGSYSSYGPLAAFATEAEARALVETLGGTDDYRSEFHVEEFPILPPGAIVVEALPPVAHGTIAVYWTGAVCGERPRDDEVFVTPRQNVRLTDKFYDVIDRRAGYTDEIADGVPDLEVKAYGFEQQYTIGTSLQVRGLDVERVRKVYSEKRAELLANAAAWAVEHYPPDGRYDWLLDRTENADFRKALGR